MKITIIVCVLFFPQTLGYPQIHSPRKQCNSANDRLLRKLLRNEYLFYWIAFHEDQFFLKKMKLSKSPYSLIQNRNDFLFLQINGIFLEMLTVLFYCTEEISTRKFSLAFSEHNINTWAYLGVVTWKRLSVIRYSCGTLQVCWKHSHSNFSFICKINSNEVSVSFYEWKKLRFRERKRLLQDSIGLWLDLIYPVTEMFSENLNCMHTVAPFSQEISSQQLG